MTLLLRQPAQFFGFLRKLFSSIGVIPLAVLPIVGVTLSLVAFQEYQLAQLSEYRLLEAYARNADIQIAGALTKIDHQLHQMANEQLKNRSVKDASVFGRELRAIPEIGTWLVTDATGRIRVSSDPAIVGRDVSQEPYFTAHLDHEQAPEMFTSRPDKRLLGVTSVAFTLPIVGANGQFSGIVGVTTGFRFFPRVLLAINSEDSASMSVIYNREGDLLFRRSEPEKFFGTNIVAISKVFHWHVDAGRQVTRHIGPSAQDGKTRLFLVRDVGNTGLGLIISRQLDEVLAVWRRSVAIYILIFTLTAVGVIYLAIVATRRKRQVLASKAFSDQLIATANVMVVGLDADGRITLFNQTAERLSGYRHDEVLGHRWFDFVLPPNAPPEVMEMVGRFREGGDLPRTAEHAIKDKSGQKHIISWQNSVIQTPRATISFGIDVTQRKRMEEDLVASMRRAENSNSAKSKFLAAISHDVRQPLHAQALFLDVLARTELSTHQRDLLDSANAAAKSCGEMLNTLLDFSRVEAGIMTPRQQSFRLQPLLNKIEREFGPQSDAKGIVYRSRETDLLAQSDPMLVELILRNLVSNAIRYTERGGLLVTCRKRGAEVLLEVWDTGIGISTAHQQAVFREFFQLNNPERDRQRGLGLGLAIVDSLARSLNHRLSLASTPGRGSVFRLSMPIATGNDLATVFPDTVPESGRQSDLTLQPGRPTG